MIKNLFIDEKEGPSHLTTFPSSLCAVLSIELNYFVSDLR